MKAAKVAPQASPATRQPTRPAPVMGSAASNDVPPGDPNPKADTQSSTSSPAQPSISSCDHQGHKGLRRPSIMLQRTSIQHGTNEELYDKNERGGAVKAQKRREACRLLTIAALTVVLGFLSFLLYLQLEVEPIEGSARFAVGEVVRIASLSACDVAIVRGAEPLVAWKVKPRGVVAVAASPTLFSFISSRSCPAAGCFKICSVTISVCVQRPSKCISKCPCSELVERRPASSCPDYACSPLGCSLGAAQVPRDTSVYLHVEQAANDEQPSSLTAAGPVDLYELRMCGVGRPCPTLALGVTAGARIRSLRGVLLGGDVTADGATLDSVDLELVGGGSFYHLNVPSGQGASHVLEYRQPSETVCIGSDTIEAFDLAAPWAICDIRSILDNTADPADPANVNARKSFGLAQNTFDRDGDGLVQRSEFVAGYSDFRCDGAFAGHKCMNGGAALRFIRQSEDGAPPELSMTAVLRRIVDMNATGLVGGRAQGGCYRSLTVAATSGADFDSGSGVPDSTRSEWRVWSDSGQILVTLDRQANDASVDAYASLFRARADPTGGGTVPLPNTTFNGLVGERVGQPAVQRGLAMHGADAARISTAYAARFGAHGSGGGELEDGAIIFNVKNGLPLLGGEMFIYVTNPIYLIIGLPWLETISWGRLSPLTFTEDVRFVNVDCAPYMPREQYLAQVYQELWRAMHPDGEDFSTLRGKLFLVNTTKTDGDLRYGTPEYVDWQPMQQPGLPRSPSVRFNHHEDIVIQGLRNQVWTAYILICVTSVIVACLAVKAVSVLTRIMLRADRLEQQGRFFALQAVGLGNLAKEYGPPPLRLDFPMLIVQRLVAGQFEAADKRSVHQFLRSGKYVVESVRGLRQGRHPPEILFHDFMKSYHWFCLRTGRQPLQQKPGVLRQVRCFLPADVIARQRNTRKVYGLRKRTTPKPRPSPPVISSLASAEEEAKQLLEEFLYTTYEVTGKGSDHVVLRYQTTPYGDDDTSIYGKFSLWCQHNQKVRGTDTRTVPETLERSWSEPREGVDPFEMVQDVIRAVATQQNKDARRVVKRFAYVGSREEMQYTIIGLKEANMDDLEVPQQALAEAGELCSTDKLVRTAMLLVWYAALYVLPSFYFIFFCIRANERYVPIIGHPYAPANTLTLADVYMREPLPNGEYFVVRHIELLMYFALTFLFTTIAYLPIYYMVRLLSRHTAQLVKEEQTGDTGKDDLGQQALRRLRGMGHGVIAAARMAKESFASDDSRLSRNCSTAAVSAPNASNQYVTVANMYMKEQMSLFKSMRFADWVDVIFSAVFCLQVVFFAMCGSFIMLWVLFACLMYPERSLPIAISLFTVLFVAVFIYHVSFEAQRRFKETFHATVHELVAKRLSKAIELKKLKVNQQHQVRSNREAVNLEDSALYDLDFDEQALTPADIFRAVDVLMGSASQRSDGLLDKGEFERFLDQCDFPLTTNRRERMWVLCESDADGTISLLEFQKGWEAMMDEFAQVELGAVGLSTSEIVFSLLMVVLALSFMCLALVVVTSAWHSSGFSSVVQSGTIAGVGGITSIYQANSKGSKSKVRKDVLKSTIAADAAI